MRSLFELFVRDLALVLGLRLYTGVNMSTFGLPYDSIYM